MIMRGSCQMGIEAGAIPPRTPPNDKLLRGKEVSLPVGRRGSDMTRDDLAIFDSAGVRAGLSYPD